MKKIFTLSFLSFFFQISIIFPVYTKTDKENQTTQTINYYPCEEDWIEVMFASEFKSQNAQWESG